MTLSCENSFRTTLICIDSYENKILQGRLYNAYLEKGIEFLGVIDFFQNMEKIFDETNYPQAFSVKRMFRPGIEVMSTNTEENVKEGKLATFSMRLLFRQNASWQGSVYWHEGKSDENFRSALELLFLMDSAISTIK